MSFVLLFAIFLTNGASAAGWERVPVLTTASLRGLSAASENVIWASGAGGTVIRTIDGGNTWTVETVKGAENLDFRGMHAFDGLTAIVMSSGKAEDGQARFYRTTDGGRNWKLVFEEKTRGVF